MKSAEQIKGSIRNISKEMGLKPNLLLQKRVSQRL